MDRWTEGQLVAQIAISYVDLYVIKYFQPCAYWFLILVVQSNIRVYEVSAKSDRYCGKQEAGTNGPKALLSSPTQDPAHESLKRRRQLQSMSMLAIRSRF
jgi:hypothetical protein